MKRLSSYSTFVKKYLAPIFISAMGVLLLRTAKEDHARYIIAAAFALGLAWLLWWRRPIRFVSTDGTQFLISDLRRRILVPVSQLSYWTEDRLNRSPSICLYFDPPTEFGRKIKIIPPTDFWSRERFDAVARCIGEISGKNKREV